MSVRQVRLRYGYFKYLGYEEYTKAGIKIVMCWLVFLMLMFF